MSVVPLNQLPLFRQLDNGKSIRQAANGRLFLFDSDGSLMGEILPGSLTAQLLSLRTEDFGYMDPAPPSAAPSAREIVAGPTSGYVAHPSGGISAMVERWKAAARERWERRKRGE